MKKYNYFLLLLLLFVPLTSCQLFTTDITPAMLASSKMEDIGVNALDTVEELIKNAEGLEAEAKSELLQKVSTERQKLTTLYQELQKLLESYGDINWREIATDAYSLYKDLRARE
jgi:uncharacterized protein YlxW (UPF0749 family)